MISAGSSLLSFACVGIGFYGLTVFLDALRVEHAWSRASISGATALYFVIAAVVGTAVGRLVDRFGARGFIVAGALVMGAALLMIGRLEERWQLYAAYVLMSVGYAMCGGVPIAAVVTRWFVSHRARAMTFTHTGVSVGGILLVPLATWLIQERGLEVATRVLAALVVGIAVPVALLVLRFDPRDHGLEPDGGAPPQPRTPGLVPGAQGRHWRPREVLRTRAFWLLALAFAAILFCQQAMLIHQLAFLRERMDASTAALAVSTVAFGSAAARLVVGGIFADRVDKRRLGVALFLVQALALLGFTVAPSTPALFAAALVFGFTIGNIFLLQALLVGEIYGRVSFGTAYGMLQLVTQVVGSFGPLALGVLYDALGGYATGVRILAGTAVFAALVLSRVGAPRVGAPPLPAS